MTAQKRHTTLLPRYTREHSMMLSPFNRYNWQPIRTPLSCGCGAKFSVEHALSCPKGGFPSTKSGTWLLTSQQRCAVMSVPNQSCNPSLEKCSEVLLLTLSQAQDWTSLQMGSGRTFPKNICRRQEYSTLSPPPTLNPTLQPATANMN